MSRRSEVTNSEDVIDSRDVIDRIEELQTEYDDLEDGTEETAEWISNNADKLAALKALAKQGEAYSDDWEYGSTLIRDSYFVDYCEELVKDIDGLPRNLPAYIVVDWAATANNLRVDYTDVEFDGVTYWVR